MKTQNLSVADLNQRLRQNYNPTQHGNLNPSVMGKLASVKPDRIVRYMAWLGLDLNTDILCLCGNYDDLVNRIVSLNAVKNYSFVEIKTAVKKILKAAYAKLPQKSFNEVLINAIENPNEQIIKRPKNKSTSNGIKKRSSVQSNVLTPNVVQAISTDLNNQNLVNNTQVNIFHESIDYNQDYLANQNEIDDTYQALLAKISNEMFQDDAPTALQANPEQLNYQPLLESISKEMSLDAARAQANQEQQLNHQQFLATISNEMFSNAAPVQADHKQQNYQPFSPTILNTIFLDDTPVQANQVQHNDRVPDGERKLTNLKYNELILKIKDIFNDAKKIKNQSTLSHSNEVLRNIRGLFVSDAFINNQEMIEYLATYNIKLIQKNSFISLHALVGWENISDDFFHKRKHQQHISDILAAFLDYTTDFKKNKVLQRIDYVKVKTALSGEFNLGSLSRITGNYPVEIKKIFEKYGLVGPNALIRDCSDVLNNMYQAMLGIMDTIRKEGQNERGTQNAIWHVVNGFFNFKLTDDDKLKTFSAWNTEAIILDENTQRIIPANQTFFSPPHVWQGHEPHSHSSTHLHNSVGGNPAPMGSQTSALAGEIDTDWKFLDGLTSPKIDDASAGLNTNLTFDTNINNCESQDYDSDFFRFQW